MGNTEKYNKAFVEVLGIAEADLCDNLEYMSVEEWDSVGHMQLIAALEDEFDIMLDADDIIDFSSYKKGIEILSKYDVKL